MNLTVALEALQRLDQCAYVITHDRICNGDPEAHVHGPEEIVNLARSGRPKMGVRPSCVGAHHPWVVDPVRLAVAAAIEALPDPMDGFR